MKEAFICPNCGAVSTKENLVLEERWDEVLRLSYDPETGMCIEEEKDELGLRCVHCCQCHYELTAAEVDDIFDLLVEVEEKDGVLYIRPVGKFYLQPENQKRLIKALGNKAIITTGS